MNRRRFLTSAAVAAAWGALPGSALAQAAGALASGRPSATAQGAAFLRAAHQLLDEPAVLPDPFALEVIGSSARSALEADPGRFDTSRTLRAFVALRSRYAEDRLDEAVARGVTQYVLLGAGLDTFSFRNRYPGLKVFEVDHPATQRWKEQRIDEAHLAIPKALRFAPVDFERETLAEGLRRAGFDEREPAFFSMLGVAIYLTRPALMETLAYVASRPAQSEIVFSYTLPGEYLTRAQKAAREVSAARVAAIGEPWISYYDPRALAADLQQIGFNEVRDLEPREANLRYFREREDGLRVSGSGRMMSARV